MYGKLFESMYDGTLVEDWRALVTFQQMIILCDSNGFLTMSIKSLSARTNIPQDIISVGIKKLMKVDQHSLCNACGADSVDITFNEAMVRIELSPSKDRRFLPSSWPKLRLIVFERDRFVCQYCGDKAEKLECDHIIPWSKGGTDDLENLATSCAPCNRSKGAKLISEWRTDA